MNEALELSTASALIRPPFPSRKHWIRWSRLGDYRDVGINEDGSLHNPNGHPEEPVCAAIADALEAERRRRSAGARIASTTRAERHEKQLYRAARRVLEGLQVANSTHCDICKKALTDEQSIARGIGPECWQGVLGRIDWMRRQRGEIPTAADNQGQLWRWHLERWEGLSILNTTDTHVLVHEKARMMGEWPVPQDIHALDRTALEANGWADHAAKGFYKAGRYFTCASKEEIDYLRDGPVVYPLLGLPGGLPRPFIEAAYHRANEALRDATSTVFRSVGASPEARNGAWAKQHEQSQRLSEERKRALVDGDCPLLQAKAGPQVSEETST